MTLSLDRPTALTKLDAVNLLLAARGDTKVASLGNTASRAAVEAEDVLASTALEVMQDDWNFNTEEKLGLAPNSDGYIYLPENLLKFSPTYISAGLELADRGGRLYDRRNSTFAFSSTVYLKATFALAFDDCPQVVRWYFAIKAAFQYGNQNTPGDPSLRVDANHVAMAEAQFISYDRELGPKSLRQTSPHFMRIRGNR
jgi:hypothetical protein